jgi:hypothetical protein
LTGTPIGLNSDRSCVEASESQGLLQADPSGLLCVRHLVTFLCQHVHLMSQVPREETPRLMAGGRATRGAVQSGLRFLSPICFFWFVSPSPHLWSSLHLRRLPMSSITFPMAHGSSKGRGRGRRATPRRGGATPDPWASSSSTNEAVHAVC